MVGGSDGVYLGERSFSGGLVGFLTLGDGVSSHFLLRFIPRSPFKTAFCHRFPLLFSDGSMSSSSNGGGEGMAVDVRRWQWLSSLPCGGSSWWLGMVDML